MVEDNNLKDQKKIKINPGRVTHGPFKFYEGFKQSLSFVAVSNDHDQYALGIQSVGGRWAVINSTGKVIRKGDSLSDHKDKDQVGDLLYIQKQRAFFIHEEGREEIWKMSLYDLKPRLWIAGDIYPQLRGGALNEVHNGKAIAIIKSDSEVWIIEFKEDGSVGREVITDLLTDWLIQIEVGGPNGNILIGLDEQKKNKLISCKIKDDFTVKVVGSFDLSSVVGLNHR